MIFIKPSIQEIYDKFASNDEIVNYLKENNMLVTRSYLIDKGEMSVNQSDTALFIRLRNQEILYHLAEVLDRYEYDFTSKRIYDLSLERVGFDEIAIALRKDPKKFPVEAYKKIIFTYKYCSVSSFFQNNRDSFMPEYDFLELNKNESAKAFYDAMMKEFDKLDCVLSKCCEYLDFDKIPWDMITYLTQLLGFEKSTIDASMQEEHKFRELSKNILDIYRIKGTNYSFELFFNFLGFNLEMREFYFDRRLYYNLNSGGNQETDSTDMYKYEFYLTNSNPINNSLKDIGTDEIVGPEDITPQYSLHEFEELCNKYGPAAVLGYSPIYNIVDKDTGKVTDTKVYEDKVYKYFKTNLIYYNVSLPNSNPTTKQIKAITKYLDFLTPSYVMRTIKINSYEEKNDEELGFDGDGEKKPDGYGNFNGFEMLDGEDWNHEFEDKFTKIVGEDNKRKIVNEGHYSGLQETYKEYVNSIGGNDFRQPIDHKIINKSVSRFLTNSSGVDTLDYKRLNYYIVNKIGDTITDYPNGSGVAIYPYYTIPPHVANDVPYFDIVNRFDKHTKNVDLLGYLKEDDDIEEGEKREKRIDNVKTQIKMANIVKPVDFITNSTISDFVKNNEKFNELYYTEILNRILIPVAQYSFGTADRPTILDSYVKDLNAFNISNLDRIKINSLKEKLDDLESEGYYNSEEYKKIEKEINKELVSQSFKNMDIVNMPLTPEIYKNLTYGDCIVSMFGDEKKGEFVVYRFGNPMLPNKLSNTYKRDYKSYLESFDYMIKKDYNGTVIGEGKAQVGLNGKYITKNNLSEIRKYVNSLKELMISTFNDNASSPDKWFDINYITDLLFLNKEDNEYYRALKCPKKSPFCVSMIDHHVFNNLEEAELFFKNEHPERRVCNTEFFITNNDEKGKPIGDPSLYTFAYRNRIKGSLIYSTKDEMLYRVVGNSIYDIRPAKQFFGNLSIYKEDENGNLGFVDGVLTNVNSSFVGKKYSLGLCEDETKMYAEINQYDSTWEGYDEFADLEDFIFYNHYNNIRPIKSATDREFDDDLKNSNEFDPKYIEEGIDVPKIDPLEGKYDRTNHYYITIAQNLVREISSKTIDNFTNLENINWEMDYIELIPEVLHDIDPSYLEMYERNKLTKEEISKGVKEHPWKPSKTNKCDPENKDYATYTHIGILSIIEGNLEKATGKENRDREYDYYAKASSFLQDYYRIILKNNFETRHFPISFVKDMFGIKDPGAKIPATFSDAQIEEIKKRYRISILQIASILENISRNRVYYSLIGRWEKMIIRHVNNENAGVWTRSLKEYCPGLDKLWRSDPFAVDVFNPMFFKSSKTDNDNLREYFKKYNLESEFSSYRNYRDSVIIKNTILYNNILKMSNIYRIIDKRGNYSYPFPVKTNFAKTIDNSYRLLKRKYSQYIKIEGGAKEELLGKDAYSLNGQHVYNKGEIYSYKKTNLDGSSYVRNMELNFGLTCDSNGDFYLPYNLNYGLQKYSIDEYGKHREIYSEFTEMLDLFYNSIYEHSGKQLDSYLKQYYYSSLLRDYREKEIKDDQPLGLSISGKKPARIYPKLTEVFNGKAGTFLSKSTLLSSYNNNGGYDDTNVKLNFSKVSLVMDKYKTGVLRFNVTHKDFMDAFGYDYNDYYKYLTIRKLAGKERKAIVEEINKMYKKQFACVRPIFLFKDTDKSKEYYSKNRTLWQKIRNNFSKDYPTAEARACDKDGHNITDKDGYIVDKDGNRYPGEEADIAFERFKDSFINGFIEIKITDDDTIRSLFGIKEIDNFIDKSEDDYFGIINLEEMEHINGYLSVKELRHSFMDNYISFPQSLDWIERDENNIAKEYYSFGDDRSVNITKRNVYFSPEESEVSKKAKEDDTLTEEERNKIIEKEKEKEKLFKDRNFKKIFTKKKDEEPGFLSLHDEDVIEVSDNGYPLDSDGKEILNYDKTVRFEEQGITPKYKKVEPNKRLAHSDGFLNNNFLRYGKVFDGDTENEIKIPFKNCSIAINEIGDVILRVPSEMLHTSKLDKIKVIFSLPFVILNTVRRRIFCVFNDSKIVSIINTLGKSISMLLRGKINITNVFRVISNKSIKIESTNDSHIISVVRIIDNIISSAKQNIKKIKNVIILSKWKTQKITKSIVNCVNTTIVNITKSLTDNIKYILNLKNITSVNRTDGKKYGASSNYDIDKTNLVVSSLYGELENYFSKIRNGIIELYLLTSYIAIIIWRTSSKINKLSIGLPEEITVSVTRPVNSFDALWKITMLLETLSNYIVNVMIPTKYDEKYKVRMSISRINILKKFASDINRVLEANKTVSGSVSTINNLCSDRAVYILNKKINDMYNINVGTSMTIDPVETFPPTIVS